MQNLVIFPDKGPLDVQTRRLLKKYKERKQQTVGRQQKVLVAHFIHFSENSTAIFHSQFQWRNILAKKPCPGVIDPAEIESFEQAKNAIGNFILKSDPENIAVERNPEKLTITKYLELKRLRDEIQQMKRDFNGQVIAARQQKIDLCDYVSEQLKKLQAIHVEIPSDHIKNVEMIPSIDENVELLDKKFRMAAAIADGEMLISHKTESDQESGVKSDFYQAVLQMSIGPSTLKCNETETELRKIRLTWKLFEQDMIIDGIEKRIREFDEHLLMLENRRLEVALEVNFMELYYFTVYQELMVLKSFEQSQTILMQDIDVGRCERSRIEAKIMKEKTALQDLKQRETELAAAVNRIEGDGEFISFPEMKIDNDTGEYKSSCEIIEVFIPRVEIPRQRIFMYSVEFMSATAIHYRSISNVKINNTKFYFNLFQTKVKSICRQTARRLRSHRKVYVKNVLI